jgi:hypothetical protein
MSLRGKLTVHVLSNVLVGTGNDNGKSQEPELRPRDHFERVLIKFGVDLKPGTSPTR